MGESTCQLHKKIESEIEQFNKEKIAMVQKLNNTKETVSNNVERIKVANKRIHDLEENNKNLTELTTSVKVLASEVKHMVEKLNDHEGRLDNIEEKPAIYWKHLITTGIGLIAGYLFSLAVR